MGLPSSTLTTPNPRTFARCGRFLGCTLHMVVLHFQVRFLEGSIEKHVHIWLAIFHPYFSASEINKISGSICQVSNTKCCWKSVSGFVSCSKLLKTSSASSIFRRSYHAGWISNTNESVRKGNTLHGIWMNSESLFPGGMPKASDWAVPNPLSGDKHLNLSSISACPADCQILRLKKAPLQALWGLPRFQRPRGHGHRVAFCIPASRLFFQKHTTKTQQNLWQTCPVMRSHEKFHSFGLRDSEHGNLLLTFRVLSVSINDIKKWTPIPTGQDIISIRTSIIYTLQYLLQEYIYIYNI